MATIDEIKQQAASVKNATKVGENTAERVGGALAGLADIAKAQEDNIGKKADKAAVDAELGKKANTEDVDTKFTEEKKRVDAELVKKFDKENISKELGDSDDMVVSQSALPFRYIDNEEFFAAWLDADNHFLLGIRRDGQIIGEIQAVNDLKKVDAQFQADITNLQDTKVDKEEGKSLIEDEVKECFKVIDDEEFFAVWLDEEENILMGIRRDGEFVGNISDLNVLKDTIIEIQKEISKLNKSDVVTRNSSRLPAVMSACRYKGGTHDFQMCIITDSHAEELAVQNAVSLCNNIDVIDSIIHCGDIVSYTYDKSEVSTFMNDIKKCDKPWLIVIGNHDIGNTMYVHYGATHDEAYESFIKPMVTNNILREGEYQAGKSYYYHDFPSRKVRIIVIYDYDNPLDIADNDYWDTIEYDPSIPKVIPGNKYFVGDKINCGGFVGKSFVCKKEVKTIDGSGNTEYTMPYYKVGRAVVCIGKEQAQWLVSTLKSTPAGYGIIIATHSPAMLNSTNQTQYNFAIDTPKTGKEEGMNAMYTDLLPEIMDAFINKSAKQIHVKMKSAGWHKADASYLNTTNGSNGEKYAYDLDVDFTERNDCYFAGYIGGHVHDDLIYKHDSYKGQYSVNPVCAITEQANRRHADIIDVREDSLCYDALTCFSCSKGRIALSRLGNTLSINGKHRDIEIINTNI